MCAYAATGDAGDAAGEFREVTFYAQAPYCRAICSELDFQFVKKLLNVPRWTKATSMAFQGVPRWSKGCPKGPKRNPEGAKSLPKERKRRSKDTQRRATNHKTIYR